MHDNFEPYDDAQGEAVTPPLQSVIDHSKQGIDIRQRHVGDTILIETDNGIYELVIVDPTRQYVEVSGTDPRLHTATVGLLDHSFSALDRDDKRQAWIGPARRLVIVFRNAVFETGVVLSASVRGKEWHLDVF